MRYRNEAHEHEAIEQDFERQIAKIEAMNDIEELRKYAKNLSEDLRVFRANLADWRWGRVSRAALRIAPKE